MVSTASIKINRGRSADNGNGGQNIDKAMLKELKNMSSIFSRASKLTQSGLGGGAGGAGLLSRLVGGTGAVVGGIAGAAASTFDVGSQVLNRAENLESGEAFRLSDEGNVEKFNLETGELIDTIDKQNAVEKGILDNRGDLLDIYEGSNKSAEEFVSNLDIYNEESSPLFHKIVNGIKNMVSSIFGVEENLNSFAAAVKEAERKLSLETEQKLGINTSQTLGQVAVTSGGALGSTLDISSFTNVAQSNTIVRDK